ncbi:hypothetical protein [uncultured Desulfosarcina sp.]|uniref:hypothetical protein n=1 Tax=uncultured Desulfosarcina sp. TaxID=218289 RepID=UPI0029C76AFA|nr:hypothetical protein [uncultured Desulfosarcina sp.]
MAVSDDYMDGNVTAWPRSVKDYSIARELTDIKAILNWSVKRRSPLFPFNPVGDYQGSSKKDKIILRHGFVTIALHNGTGIGILGEIVGSRPETLSKHNPHMTSAMHRNTMDKISGLGMGDDA